MSLPDVTALLVAYLTPLNPTVRVASRVPNPRPDEFVQVRRVGGTGRPPVADRARIDLLAWGGTEERATELGGSLRESVWALAGNDRLGVTCYKVSEILAQRLDDDEETGTPRSWSTFDILVRADAIIHQAL